MNREDDFFLQLSAGVPFHIGVVEDRMDPAQLGRVRVRVFGIHSDNKEEVPTEALPWATVMMPATMAAQSGVGSVPPGLVVNTWVVLFFRDGMSCQDPIILGTLPTNSSAKYGGTSATPSPGSISSGLSVPVTQSQNSTQQSSSISGLVKNNILSDSDRLKQDVTAAASTQSSLLTDDQKKSDFISRILEKLPSVSASSADNWDFEHKGTISTTGE